MSEPLDPFELLRDLNPVKPEDVAEAASCAEATQALEEIIAGTRKPTSKWRLRRPQRLPSRRRTYALVLVVGLAIGVVAAAAWALTQGASKHLTIGCYARGDLHARTIVVPAGTETAANACRSLWRKGNFGVKTTPSLQACVLPSGAIGVFPSANQRTCAKLHLVPLAPTTPTPTNTAPLPIKLKNALVSAFLATRCMKERQAIATIRSEFGRLGFKAWRLHVKGPFTSERPCASLAFDEPAQTVLVIPIPRRP